MVTAMALDMTAELAPLVWGLVVLLAASGLMLLASMRPPPLIGSGLHRLAKMWNGATRALQLPRRRATSMSASLAGGAGRTPRRWD